jgi:hypothetical protein
VDRVPNRRGPIEADADLKVGVVIGEQRLADLARPVPKACEDPLKAICECTGLTGLLGLLE